MREVSIQRKFYTNIQENITKNIRKGLGYVLQFKEKIPKTVLSIWEESGDVKCHVATKGSIFDFVGDRVHG